MYNIRLRLIVKTKTRQAKQEDTGRRSLALGAGSLKRKPSPATNQAHIESDGGEVPMGEREKERGK